MYLNLEDLNNQKMWLKSWQFTRQVLNPSLGRMRELTFGFLQKISVLYKLELCKQVSLIKRWSQVFCTNLWMVN